MHTYNFVTPAKHHGMWSLLASDLLSTTALHTGEWQAMNTAASPAHATYELEDVTLRWDQIPAVSDIPRMMPNVDLSWAAEHFAERVSGIPYNPAPSHLRWPYAVRGNADHTRCPTCDSPEPRKHPATQSEGEVTHICHDPFHSGRGGQFDHTYPERFWPKYAGLGNAPVPPVFEGNHHKGIRFPHGDLDDVVELLIRSPLTRQAFLPVWFPEDTGAFRDGKPIRVPCTLGYHFMQRHGKLSCRYFLRSCDLYRHLSNDVYFAAMLTWWVADQMKQRAGFAGLELGSLTMHISSLHAFVGDVPKIKERMANA